MEKIMVSAALVVILAACGSEAESREDAESQQVTQEAPSQPVRPIQAGPEQTAPPVASARVIPAGSFLTFEVQEDVSTASHHVGDFFELVLVDAVSGGEGAFLAAGTSARGMVTEVQRSSGPDDPSLLAVRVTSIEVAGSQAALEGQVQSTAVESITRASGARTAATVATGSAAGAIIGQVLGKDTRSAITGAAVGTAVGVVVALATRGGDSTLGKGSRIVVRLDRDLGF